MCFLNIPQPTSFRLLHENGSQLGHQMTSTMKSHRIISVFILLNLSIIWCSPFPKTFFPWHYPFQFFSQQDNHPPLFASDLSHRLPYQCLGLTTTYSIWHHLWRRVWTFHGIISQARKLNAPSQPTKLAGLQWSRSHLVFSHLIFSLKSLKKTPPNSQFPIFYENIN